MDRKAVLGIAVLAAVLVAGCTSSDGSEPSDGPATGDGGVTVPDADVVVNYTADGFEPATVTVQQGETVAWVDRHPNADMWIGSDRHPVHTEYDGTSVNEHCPSDGAAFDQCQTGETYTFTFQQTGDWTYHNHVRSGDGGTVVVE